MIQKHTEKFKQKCSDKDALEMFWKIKSSAIY